MHRRRAALLALALALAGCATTVPGTGTPAAAEPAAIELPPRPRDVPLDGVRPCELLDADQRAALELDGRPVPSDGTDGLTGPGDACSISAFGRRALSFSIKLAPEAGIERFTTPAFADRGVRAIDVAGFPALLSPPPASMPDNCLVLVDVAPGQVLTAMLSDGGREPAIPVDELCRDVPRYTAEVMRTLIAG